MELDQASDLGFNCNLTSSEIKNYYCDTKTVDLRKASRFLVRVNFSSASDAFFRIPLTTSSGAFSMNLFASWKCV